MKKNTIIAKDKKHLKELIKDCIKKEGYKCDLNHIDVSQVSDMSFLFSESKFNGDISEWDVSKVKNMAYMFFDSQFNGNISEWKVSQVTDMSFMFQKSKFNGDISHWMVENVESIDYIFMNCSHENIPYWAKIEDFKERQNAVIEYHVKQEREKISNTIINSCNKCIHKI